MDVNHFQVRANIVKISLIGASKGVQRREFKYIFFDLNKGFGNVSFGLLK